MVLVRFVRIIKGFKVGVKYVHRILAIQGNDLLLVVIVKHVKSFTEFQLMVNHVNVAHVTLSTGLQLLVNVYYVQDIPDNKVMAASAQLMIVQTTKNYR